MALSGGTHMSYLISSLLPLLSLALFLYIIYLAALPRPLPGIPYNKHAAGHVLGDLPEIRKAKSRRAWIWDQPRQHGGAVSQVFFGPALVRPPTVIVTDYREAVDICTRRHKEFDRGHSNKNIVGLVAPNFHFTMESRDPQFRANRELVRDLMTPKFLQQVSAPRVYDRASSLVDLWTLKMRKGHGRPFIAVHDLYLSTLDTICAVAFGMEADKAALGHQLAHVRAFNPGVSRDDDEPVDFPTAPLDDEHKALLNIPEMLALAQKSPTPTLAQYMALLKPKNAKAWWYRRSLIKRQTRRSLTKLAEVGESKGEGEQHQNMESALDHLLLREMNAARKASRQPDLHSAVIRDELLGFLLGGHDTSAAVLSWWVKYMARHQDVQKRLRDALRKAHSAALEEDRWPTMSEINGTSIAYLDAVLEETTRYAAVATIIAREATCDTQILGCPIPKGTTIMLLLTGPSLKEAPASIPDSLRTSGCLDAKDKVALWDDDGANYRPERWLKRERDDTTGIESEVFDPLAGPTLAFSVGPRQCFGRKLAYMQLRAFMTLLAWNFNFGTIDETLDSDEPVEKMINIPQDCYIKVSKA